MMPENKNPQKTQREMISEIHTHVTYLRKDVDEIKKEQQLMKKEIETLKISDARQDEHVKNTARTSASWISALISGVMLGLSELIRGVAR
jgi:F0F1-type ATP synthase assembly protein I